MSKKNKKERKKLLNGIKKEVKELKLTKHHFYYTIMVLILLILSIFFFNNYNKCNLYEVNVNSDDIVIKNGFLAMSDGNNFLQIDNIEYVGTIENVTSVSMELYVKVKDENKLINSFSSFSEDGFSLKDYFYRVNFNINETKNNEIIITKDIKKNIVNNMYLKVSIVTDSGEKIDKDINLILDKLYSNDKLFY